MRKKESINGKEKLASKERKGIGKEKLTGKEKETSGCFKRINASTPKKEQVVVGDSVSRLLENSDSSPKKEGIDYKNEDASTSPTASIADSECVKSKRRVLGGKEGLVVVTSRDSEVKSKRKLKYNIRDASTSALKPSDLDSVSKELVIAASSIKSRHARLAAFDDVFGTTCASSYGYKDESEKYQFLQNSCTNCGGIGHVAKACFHKPYAPSNAAQFRSTPFPKTTNQPSSSATVHGTTEESNQRPRTDFLPLDGFEDKRARGDIPKYLLKKK